VTNILHPILPFKQVRKEVPGRVGKGKERGASQLVTGFVKKCGRVVNEYDERAELKNGENDYGLRTSAVAVQDLLAIHALL